MRALKFLLIMGWLIPGSMLWAQTSPDSVQQARAAYDRGDYSAAATLYQSLATSGAQSAELFYNLGNAEFKAGHLGQAVAAFRRALKRAPQDEDIRFNLEYVRAFIHQPGEHKGPLAHWLENAFDFFTGHELALGALAVFWMLSGFTAGLILIRGSSRIWLRWVTAGLALAFLLLAGWGVARLAVDRATQWGVIIASRSEARNGPNQEFQVGFVIPEGREVRVLGHEGNWIAVGLPSEGYKGWIKREDLAEDE